MTDLETARQALRDHAAVGAVGPMFERLLRDVERSVWDEAVRETGYAWHAAMGHQTRAIAWPAYPYREDT